MKEQFAPDEHRDIASFNTDNEFNRAINEEDTDFNTPGLPDSTVKQLHGASVRELIQKIVNHPHRHALQSDLQQRRQFNPFGKESKGVIREVGDHEYFTANSLKKKCKKRHFLGIHDRFIRDEKFRKICLTLAVMKKYVVKWTNWRTKTTRTT